jgi:hypothetical protein
VVIILAVLLVVTEGQARHTCLPAAASARATSAASASAGCPGAQARTPLNGH